MFWQRWHKPVNDHEDFRHHLACFLLKHGDVQLNMIEREDGAANTEPIQARQNFAGVEGAD